MDHSLSIVNNAPSHFCHVESSFYFIKIHRTQSASPTYPWKSRQGPSPRLGGCPHTCGRWWRSVCQRSHGGCPDLHEWYQFSPSPSCTRPCDRSESNRSSVLYPSYSTSVASQQVAASEDLLKYRYVVLQSPPIFWGWHALWGTYLTFAQIFSKLPGRKCQNWFLTVNLVSNIQPKSQQPINKSLTRTPVYNSKTAKYRPLN